MVPQRPGTTLVIAWLCLALSLSPHAVLSQSPQPFSPRPLSYHEKIISFSHLVNEASASHSSGNIHAPFSIPIEISDVLELTSSEVRDAVLRVASSMAGADDVSGDGQTQNVTSQPCLNHTVAMVMGLLAREPWALQMLDAMGKPSAGITLGNVKWPGEYTQCLKVRANTTVVSHPDFSGRYCTLYSQTPPLMASLASPVVISVGTCFPDTCSGVDITLILQAVVKMLNVSSSQINPVVTCVEETRPINAKAIVAIVICSLILFMMLAGTAVDLICIQWPSWTHLQQMSDLHPDSNDDKDDTAAVNSHPLSSRNNEYQPLLSSTAVKISEAFELGVVGQVFVAFSVYTNGKKLLSTKQAPGSLTCVHGIRFLSMSWVVLGHTWSFPSANGMNVFPYVVESFSHWSYQAIFNATVSVDTFFVLSGLLVTYLTLKELSKREGKLNWFLFYFHRFWRLTPAYMLCLMVYTCLAPYWGEGPFWPAKFPDEDFCADNWWTNLLYINNFVKFKEGCFGHSWYLANDMQFYILSPLIIVPLFFAPLWGYLVAGVFLLATAIIPGVLSQQYGLPPGITQQVEGMQPDSMMSYMVIYYIKPYNRMGAYVVGMLAGHFLYRTGCKLRIPRVLNLILWSLATACALAVLYGLFESSNGHPVTVPVAAFYNAVNRQVWALSVSWVVVACVTGNGGFVNSILSWPALVPLSRLTYVIYLLHLMILTIFIDNMRNLLYYNDINLTMLFVGMMVVISMVGFVASLAFEAPMMGLEKIFLPRTPPKNKDKL